MHQMFPGQHFQGWELLASTGGEAGAEAVAVWLRSLGIISLMSPQLRADCARTHPDTRSPPPLYTGTVHEGRKPPSNKSSPQGCVRLSPPRTQHPAVPPCAAVGRAQAHGSGCVPGAACFKSCLCEASVQGPATGRAGAAEERVSQR